MNLSGHETVSRTWPGTHIGRLASIAPYLLSLALVLPSLIWITLDTSAWGGDQSQYGFATLELYHTLTHSPRQWPARMLGVFPSKPNGLIWLGQFFVPLAFPLGSIDTALLLAIVLLQAVTLTLLYRSFRALSFGRLAVSTTACLMIASAPVFVSFAHYYFVETFQMLSVAWFILIMSLAPTWSRPLLLAQLTAATAFAFAAKEIQPLFCVWPALVGAYYLVRPSVPAAGRGPGRAALLTWLTALPLLLFTAAWYSRNRAVVLAHLLEGTYGQGVKTIWGKEDSYSNTLAYWIGAAREITFLPGLAEFFVLIAASAVMVYALSRAKRGPMHGPLCTAIAALQVVTVVMVFSLSPTRQPRYLLPVLPYFAIVLGWSLTQLNRRVVTAVSFVALAAQFVLLHEQALGAIPPRFLWVAPLDRQAANSRTLNEIVSRTCVKSAAGVTWNVLAVDPAVPGLGGDWLAPDPANYVTAKLRLLHGGGLPCHYGYLGDDFFGADVARSWKSILAHESRYVIVLDVSKYPPPPQVFNESLRRENLPQFMDRLESSSLFEREPPLQADPGVVLFRSVNHVAKEPALP